MRYMVIVKANADSEAGVMPSAELLSAMGAFNEEMAKAGIMLAGEGLHPSSRGYRIRFENGKTSVMDGPFAETKELIAGFWLIDVRSPEEAIEWMKRCPTDGDKTFELEIRKVFEASDFSPDVFPPEEQAKEEALRKELEKKRAGLA